MLFGSGEKMSMFSTHPPLNERIQRIDKSFRPEDLVDLAKKIQRQDRAAAEQASKDRATQARGKEQRRGGGMFDGENLLDQIGHPDFSRILMAATLAASIPEEISKAAHSHEWATEVLFYCLIDQDDDIREQQLLIIAQTMGGDSETRVRGLLNAAPDLASEQRLPLLEITIPELKRRPPDYVGKVLATVKAVSEADGKTDVFEYLMASIITQHLWESMNPQRVRLAGRKSLARTKDHALNLFAVLALHGHENEAGAKKAYKAGTDALGMADPGAMPQIEDWSLVLDKALPVLDQLKPADKEKLVKSLIAVVMADNRIAVSEMELLRVVCTLIHVPLPMITGGEG